MTIAKPPPQASAQAFFTYAEAYALSANSLASAEINVAHAEAPMRMLWFHAIELYLKAFLLVRGLSAAKLKSQLGHNFEKLVTTAINEGLQISSLDQARLAEIFHSDAIFQARYLEPAASGKIIFDLELLHALTNRIRAAVLEHPERASKIIFAGEGKK